MCIIKLPAAAGAHQLAMYHETNTAKRQILKEADSFQFFCFSSSNIILPAEANMAPMSASDMSSFSHLKLVGVDNGRQRIGDEMRNLQFLVDVINFHRSKAMFA